ncbi:MAG: NAD(P)/FAD-dependent oxidoreductase, partial [Planctomycetota bacterium]
MQNQALNFGTEIKASSEVTSLSKLSNGNIEVSCDDKKYTARALILAPGSDYRKLGVPGEEQFHNAGAGVSYCGTCDAPFFKGKQVVAVGGGNTAVEETLHLTKFAEKVTSTVATAIGGDDRVQSVRLKNVKTGQQEDYPCDGIFIFIGMVPNTTFLKGFVELTENGFIKCDCAYLRTNV